jgi:alginate O-acetyltransferase complex protein AlgI
MLFNSYIFIFAFFPIVLFGFFGIGRYSHALASLWVVIASLFFYGWWDIRYVSLLMGSIVFNYAAGYLIGHRDQSPANPPKMLLTTSIAINLILLGYFKYANFFTDNLNHLTGTAFHIGHIVLPLGISFFTFTQIAFLVDTYQGKVKEFNFVHYALFVTYFPHLIAGPVLHHKEMMPQFAKRNVCHINWENIAVGLSIFVLGLAKKVMLADTLGNFATPIFSAVTAGGHPMFFEAWVGALTYTFQLYFDFSAYSDMAIGLSLMLNVRLPLNFNSPYKATSIIDFWRRWHMTLSRFLRDYLYIPMGGSRNGKAQRYLNLMITMLLGGLWHGAGWTFVIWGGLHGIYLLFNHAWRSIKVKTGQVDGGKIAKLSSGLLTFFLVVVGWVFFRADSFSSAITMLHGMSGLNGLSVGPTLEAKFGHYFAQHNWLVFNGFVPGYSTKQVSLILIISFAIVWLLPNVHELFQTYQTTCEDLNKFHKIEKLTLKSEAVSSGISLSWNASVKLAFLFGLIFYFSLLTIGSNHESAFIYFQF